MYAAESPSFNLNENFNFMRQLRCLEIEIWEREKQAYLSCYEFFNAGFFPMSKADLAVAPGACIRACDQADDKSNAAHRKKDKLKGL